MFKPLIENPKGKIFTHERHLLQSRRALGAWTPQSTSICTVTDVTKQLMRTTGTEAAPSTCTTWMAAAL